MPRGLPTITFFLLLAATLALGTFWLQKKDAHSSSAASPAMSAARPIPPDAWPPIHVMAANIKLDDPADGLNGWSNRREFLAKTFLKYQPEIIACQEVSPAQGAYLHKELSQWYTWFPGGPPGINEKPTATGQTRSAAAEFIGAISGTISSLNTIYYRSDRFELLEGESGLVLPKEPQAIPTENTFFSLAVLREKRLPANASPKNPGTLIVVDVHLRHVEAFAARCATQLRLKIAATLEKYPNSGILMLGDMNHSRGTPPYAAIMANEPAASFLLDTFDYTRFPPATVNGTFHNFTGKSESRSPTDLIFAGGTLQVKTPAQIIRDQSADGRFPSDHFFMQAELDWR